MKLLYCLYKNKGISVLLIFSLLLLIFDFSIFAQNKVLRMSDAVNYAQKHSQTYKNKKYSRAKKRISLTQAIDAIKATRKKESTVRYSLLFNIKLPEKHGLPKEIDLLMKVPEIENDIKNLTKELEEVKLSDQEKTEDCFFNIYDSEQKAKLTQSYLDEMKEKLKKLDQQLLLGEANQKDVSSLQDQIQKQETQLSQYLSKEEQYKDKLSDIVGFDVRRGYTFSNPLRKYDVDRSNLNKLITYSLNNDFNIFKTRNAETIARRKVDQVYDIYGKRWGNIVKIIENDVKSNQEVDIDEMLDRYQTLLNKIDKPWVGNYVIRLLFFKIKIPKEWFKKEWDGVRYFDGEKYSIIVALKEKEDAIRETKAAEKELKTSIKDGFENLKSLWKIYDSSIMAEQRAQREYDRVFLSNKLGQASYEEVDMAKSDLMDAQISKLDNLVNYNKQLSSFNKITCGAIESLMTNEDIFLKSVQTGDSVLEYEEFLEDSLGDSQAVQEEKSDIMYYINNIVDQRHSVFGLQVMKGYPNHITHYELLAPDKNLIAKKTEIGKTVSILPIEYQGSTNFFVRLYDGDKFVDEGTFDSLVFKGKLQLSQNLDKQSNLVDDIQVQQDVNKKNVVGMYELLSDNGNAVRRIKLNIPDSYNVSYYKVFDLDGNQVGKRNKFYKISEFFSYLKFVWNDLSGLSVNLYDSNYELKYVVKFNESTNELLANE